MYSCFIINRNGVQMINNIGSQIFYNKQNLTNYNKGNSYNLSVENHYASVPINAYQDRLIQIHPIFKIVVGTKGSSFQVANQLRQLDGSLDEKILKAKDIILKDLGVPPEVVVCENRDCGAGTYAMTSIAEGKIYYNKEFCQSPNSQFSDDAVLCILRHELDHLIVCTKLYKTLGPEKYEQLLQTEAIKEILPPEMQKVNHEIFQKLTPYVDTEGFEVEKYVNAIENYNKNVEKEGIEYSNYRRFMMITGNFDNELETSARNAQYELEQKMGVSTLKDFYSMINNTKETKTLLETIKNKQENYSNKDDFVEIMFDYLFDKSMKELNSQDLPENWGKIIKNSQKYLSGLNNDDITKAYEFRSNKLKK